MSDKKDEGEVLDMGPIDQLIECQDEDDPTFLQDVIELYFEDSRSTFDLLEKTLEDPTPKSITEFGELGHKLKGSSANVGASRLAKACALMQDLGKKGETAEKCRDALDDSLEKYAEFKKAIIQLFKTRADLTPLDPAKLDG
eukprot:TRINITY_DN418_c0_g1_i2.p2 TRINITY_DN418_c0_g1~~TRINITY_DN418_c0_g1_i2.p2  ORF type:complete len:142 (+),score=39.09 TRINITY_DN418_c0_g1_i2:544-969(+)